MNKAANNTLVRTQTTLRFVCAAQLGRYVSGKISQQTKPKTVIEFNSVFQG